MHHLRFAVHARMIPHSRHRISGKVVEALQHSQEEGINRLKAEYVDALQRDRALMKAEHEEGMARMKAEHEEGMARMKAEYEEGMAKLMVERDCGMAPGWATGPRAHTQADALWAGGPRAHRGALAQADPLWDRDVAVMEPGQKVAAFEIQATRPRHPGGGAYAREPAVSHRRASIPGMVGYAIQGHPQGNPQGNPQGHSQGQFLHTGPQNTGRGTSGQVAGFPAWAELPAVCSGRGPIKSSTILPVDHVEQAFALLDADGDGTISRAEWQQHCMKLWPGSNF